MATFLDFSILSGARAVFAFLLIFILIYGLLKFSKLFGLGDFSISVLSFSVAILSVLSPAIVRVIEVVTPWYVLMMIIIVFVLITVMIFGNLGTDISAIKGNLGSTYKTIMVWIIVISIIIFISGLSYVFLGGSDSEFAINPGQENISSRTQPTSQDENGLGVSAFLDTLFHPKMIGAILFLFIATMTVLLMGYESR